MRTRVMPVLVLTLAVLLCARPGLAQTAERLASIASKTAAAKSAAEKSAAPKSAAAKSAAAARTLDATHIEGEIPVPQVLFITARDQRRFMEFQHRRYLRSSLQIGKDAALPSWIVVTHGSGTVFKEAVR